ncbi:3-ketosteroid-9-alpha-hydroxylase, partial [Streptomyces sp. SID10244]|nr:3-ketosteroid-9-alpha-hydroxylase [Streptomyces sp. SID10244]
DDLLLWGAGSGITPLFSILKSTLATGTGRLTLIYANRDADSIIFAEQLRVLADRHPDRLAVIHWLESVRE